MDNICVAIRVRPINQREANATQQLQPWSFDATQITQVSLSTGKPLSAYTFDYIYNSDIPTQSLYDGVARNIVRSSFDGINGTIFAYGQTSSGKTFTMKGSDHIPGIIPLAIQDIFSHIQKCPTREFLLRVSYLEIYNEIIQDLLNPEGKNLKIHEDLEKGIYVGGIKEEIVVSAEQVLALMQSGEDRRHIGATNMNEKSSRSHTIFRMVIESREMGTGGDRKSVDGAVKVSMLNLVDLAGSERIAHTGAEGIRQKEGGHINRSLLALSTVIAKLSEGQKQHIPYRDSKLTRILQTALGGNARTAIICTITPAAVHQEETLSTIKFATRAKNIKNKPVINEVMDEATMLRKYKDEIHTLKKQLAQREVVIEQKAEDYSAKESELETLREQIGKLKGVIIHSTVPSATESRRPKRSSRRETWCPGEGMGPIGGPVGLTLMGSGMRSSNAEDISDLDIKADIDMELGMLSYKMQDLPVSSSRKRQHTESPTPLSSDSSFNTECSTPKGRLSNISIAKIPAFQRAEMLLNGKKDSIQESAEVVEMRKELQRLKASQAELQGKVDQLQQNCDTANKEKDTFQQEAEKMKTDNEAIKHELEQMMLLAKTSYAELEDARALIDELESQENGPENWAEDKASLEKALASAQQELEAHKQSQHQEISSLQDDLSSAQEEVDALNSALSESHVESDKWKTKFDDIQTEFELAQANWSDREEELMAQQAETSSAREGSNGDASSFSEQIEELKAALADKEKMLAQAQEELVASTQEWKNKHLELHYEYEKYSEDSELDRQKLSNLLWESEKACEDLKAQLQNKDEDVDRLTSLLEELDGNRSVMPDTDSSELRAALDESKAECERLAALVKDGAEELAALQQSYDEQESAVQELTEERTKLIEDLEEKEKAISEKVKECERLSQTASSTHVLQRERDQSMLVSADLRDQIKSLQQRLDSTMVAESNLQSEAKRAEEALQARLNEAHQEKAALSDQLAKAQQEASAQVAAQVSRYQNLENELHTVTAKLEHQLALEDSLQQRVKEAEREANKHLDSLRSLEGNASNASKKVQQLQTNSDLLRQQGDSLSAKVTELTRENQKLEARLSDADRLTRDRVELLDNAARFKSDLAQTNAAYERQREELTKAQQQVKRFEESLDEANNELANLKDTISALEEKESQSSSEANRLRRDMEEREGAYRREQILHTTQIEVKENELQRIASELERAQQETAEATAQVAQLSKDLSLLTAAAKDYDRLSTELSQFKTRYTGEAAQWKEESIKLKKELKATSSTNTSAEKERDALGRDMEKLKQKMEALDGKYKQATQTICGLESDKVAAERELKQIRKQNADLERNMEKLKTTDNKIKETSASLTQITKAHEALVKTHEALTKTSDKLKADLDAKIAELAKETEAKVSLEMMLTEAQAELQLKASEIETITNEKTAELEKKKELEQVLLATVGKADEAQRKNVEYEERLEALSTETAAARQAKDQAEEEKERLCGQLTEMLYSVEENRAEWSGKEFQFTKEKEEAAAELGSVRANLQQLEASHEELKASVEEKTIALQKATEDVESLQGQVTKLQEELEKTSGELLRTVSEFNDSAEKDKEMLGKATEELEKVRGELTTTKEQFETTQTAFLKSQEEAHAMMASVEERVVELNTTKEWAFSLQEQLTHLEKRAGDESAAMRGELDNARNELQRLMQEASNQIALRDNEIRAWREKAEQLGSAIGRSEEETKMWEARVGELQAIVDKMDEEIKSLEQQNSALRHASMNKPAGERNSEEMNRLMQEKLELEAEYDAFRKEAAERESEAYAMVDKMVTDAMEAGAIRDTQSKYQKKIQDLLARLAKSETEGKRANDTCKSLQASMEQRNAELARLKNELERLHAEDETTLTKADLLSEVTRLEAVVAELKSELEAAKNVADKAQNVRKAKMDFDAMYQDRRKLKSPLADITSNKENM